MCGLLLSPAESAKQAINKANLIWITACVRIKTVTFEIRAAEQFLELSNAQLEDARRFIQTGNWLHVHISHAQLCGFWHICKA